MKIDDIIPYGRNARNNDKAVPAVAESIKEFGLKGAIVLNRTTEGGTPEHPIIVNGHTRVKAMKYLGWDEVPDDCIKYVDDLSEEEVKALRLADNRTAEIATWNKALLQSEVKKIGQVDMSKFNFDFKSKNLPRGAERLRTDRYYNLDIVYNEDCAGFYDMPTIEAVDFVPTQLLGFSYAMQQTTFDFGIHFFIDDYKFERIWNEPDKYIPLLRKFECVIMPDFSMYLDMPLPMMQWNKYRGFAMAHYWQQQGLTVIPQLGWADERSYGFAFENIPRNSTVAVSSVGCKQEGSIEYFKAGFEVAIKRTEPSRILFYGGIPEGLDTHGIEIVEYKNIMGFNRNGEDN